MSWVRLWDDMPTDPIWRVIARRSGQRIGDVIAMFNILMVQAGANADERGRTQGNDDDEIGAALDIEADQVRAIREAMQGKVLDGERLTGWEKRQPKREDGSAERARNWRERNRTQPNAEKRSDADSDAEEVVAKATTKRATKIPEIWMPGPLPPKVQALVDQWPDEREDRLRDEFHDYWRNRQRDAARIDWDKAWHNRIRDQHDRIMRETRNGNGTANGGANGAHRDEIQNPMLRAAIRSAAREAGG